MKSSLFRVCLCTLAVGVSATLSAQVPIPIEYMRPLKNNVSVGVRMLGSGSKVSFGKLGSIVSGGAPSLLALDSTAGGTIYYDNGTITRDLVGSDETAVENSTRVERLLNGERYRVYALDPSNLTPETLLRDSLSYNAARTRGWSYNDASQVVGGKIGLSVYSVTPGSAKLDVEDSGGPGFELQVGRVVQRFKKFEWGITFTAGLSDINAKTRQRIKATLNTVTDYYSLARSTDTIPTAPYVGPTSEQRTETIGGTDVAYTYETTIPLLQKPLAARGPEISTPNGANIDGYWQLKGAYYMLRIGPNIRVPISRRFTVNFGAGAAAAFTGTRFIAEETLVRPDTNAVFTREENTLSKFVPGFYADLTAEWWLTARTGFYAGASYESLKKLERTLGVRTAGVDLGKGPVIRLGVITRF